MDTQIDTYTYIYSTLKLTAVSFCIGIQFSGITVAAGEFKPPLFKPFPSYIEQQILPLLTTTQ